MRVRISRLPRKWVKCVILVKHATNLGNLFTPKVPTSILPQIMVIVALDLFHMPASQFNKKLYDTMVVCWIDTVVG